jgi:hypothetical protein
MDDDKELKAYEEENVPEPLETAATEKETDS